MYIFGVDNSTCLSVAVTPYDAATDDVDELSVVEFEETKNGSRRNNRSSLSALDFSLEAHHDLKLSVNVVGISRDGGRGRSATVAMIKRKRERDAMVTRRKRKRKKKAMVAKRWWWWLVKRAAVLSQLMRTCSGVEVQRRTAGG